MSTWIKLRDDLDTDPRIFSLGQHLRLSAQSYILTQRGRDLFGDVTDTVTDTVTRDVMRDVTICALVRVWCAANRHTTDGVFKNATLDYLDTLAQVPGFGQAMALVGYASHDPATGTVTLPRFEEYNSPNKNGQRSKTKGAERTAKYRENKRLKAQGEGASSPLLDSDSSAPADPKLEKSDASRDVTSDVTPSISSSLSKSTEGTPSDSDQSIVVPPLGGSGSPVQAQGDGSERSETDDRREPAGKRSASISDPVSTVPPPPPPADRDPLNTLKKRINALRPSWSKALHWSAEEDHALFSARHNLTALDDQDWHLLAWFFKWANSTANTGQKTPVPVTTRRHHFVSELAATLDRATTAWKQAGSPKLGDSTKPSPKSKPNPPPAPTDRATAASFADSLKSHGGALPPPRSPTVADHLLHDLGIQPKTLPPPDFDSPAYQALVAAHSAA